MTQAGVDDRFTLLCTELNTTMRGQHGAIKPRHAIAIRDQLLPLLHAARADNRTGRRLTPNQVAQMCDLFTDITGIDIPA